MTPTQKQIQKVIKTIEEKKLVLTDTERASVVHLRKLQQIDPKEMLSAEVRGQRLAYQKIQNVFKRLWLDVPPDLP